MADREFKRDGVGDEAEFEQLLAGFEPRASGVDVATLMYRAGRESGAATTTGRRAWGWPAATAAMTIVAATCTILLVTSSPQSPAVVEKVVFVPSSEPREVVDESAAQPAVRQVIPELQVAPADSHRDRQRRVQLAPRHSTYFAARRTVLSAGVDALPIVPVSRGTTNTAIPSLGSFRNDMLSGDSGRFDPAREAVTNPTGDNL